MIEAQIVVMAKEPVPGRVKTRLTPPYTPSQAAALAAAALADTLDTVTRTPVARHVVALHGTNGSCLPPGIPVIPQRGAGLDERLANAAADAYAGLAVPVMLIGMDTPQVTPDLLTAAARRLVADHTDAVYGPASDGGFWLLGLRRPDPRLILGVPMSRPDTGAAQLDRLHQAHLTTGMLPVLTDVDTAADAQTVAAQAPHGRFATTLHALTA